LATSHVYAELRALEQLDVQSADAEEAMAVLSHEGTVIDIVFTDIELPGALDGFGLAKWVREHRPRVDDDIASHFKTGRRTVR
jgi:DNA-binding LytR/AlgR family response regulator